MHFTKFLVALVAVCFVAQAQIIKSNVFTRSDIDNATNKVIARGVLGMFEWVTNSVPSYTGNHSTEAALDIDDVLGDAGVRFKYGTNEYMLMMYGTNLVLVSALDGSTPAYIAAPLESAVLNYKSLTNLFVLKTNDVGLVNLATYAEPPNTNTMAPLWGKVVASRVRLHTWDADGAEAPLLVTGDDISVGGVTATTVDVGATNIVSELANKQKTNVVADLTALAAYSGAEDTVLVSDAKTGGTFSRTTGVAADGVIVVTNTAAGSVFKRQYTGWVNVEWFSADGSDADDDTIALQAAADWAAATTVSGTRLSGQKTLYIPDGTYYLTNTVTFLCNVRCDTGAATFSCSDSGTVVVGTTSYNLFYPQITLPNITWAGTARAAGSVGVTFINLYYADVSGFRCQNFETGMLVTGGTASLGTTYSRFANGALYENKVQLKIDPSTSGWVNDNSFVSISFDAAGSRARDAASYDLYVDGDTWAPDNNRFINCSFESDCPTWFAYLVKGDNFAFRDCRYENYDSVTSTNYVKSSGTVTMTTDGTHDLVDGDVLFTGDITSGITMKHRPASGCTANTFDYTLSGGDIADTASTNTVYRAPRVWIASGVSNLLIDGGEFADKVYLDNVAAANVPAVRTTELVTADSGYSSYGVPPFRARNYTDTKASFAVYAASSTNAFQADESAATNWLAGLATDSLTIRKSGDVVPSMKLGTNYLSFGDGTAGRDVTLTRSAADTVTLDATAYLDRLGVGPTTPTVNDTYALSSVRRDHTGVSGIMVQNATNATGARAAYTMNGPTGLAYLGVAPSTASSAWANRAYIYTEDSKYGGLTLYWGNQTSDLKIYDSSVSERYRFASNGIAIKNVRAIPTAEANFGWIYANDRTSAGGNSAPWVLTEDSRRGPVAFGDRSSVTTSLGSLTGTTKIVDESGGAIGNFDTGWTVGASWTTNSSAVVSATGATNSLSHTTVTPLVGPPRFVTMTLVSGGAWTVDADASLTVTIGGNLMRTFTNGDAPSGTMTISGMVDGSTDEVVFTVYAPTSKTVSGSFDNFSIVVLAAGDFMHRHTYPAEALVKATSATAPAPYFEFSAAGTHAANGNAKDKVIALVNTTVTSAPAILATIPSTDNNGSWRLKGKVYAAYGGGASDYDNFMLELDYVDGSGTYVTSLHSTDLTGAVFAWNAAGYFLIGANADTADGDVTINTSSVELKP